MYVLFQDMLTQFMFSSIQSMVSTQLALQLARKFEKLGIDGLPVEDVYPSILDRYSEDILTVAGVYEKFKKKPDVARGAPPVAGTLLPCHVFSNSKNTSWAISSSELY